MTGREPRPREGYRDELRRALADGDGVMTEDVHRLIMEPILAKFPRINSWALQDTVQDLLLWFMEGGLRPLRKEECPWKTIQSLFLSKFATKRRSERRRRLREVDYGMSILPLPQR